MSSIIIRIFLPDCIIYDSILFLISSKDSSIKETSKLIGGLDKPMDITF